MRGDPQIIELLNEVLTSELTAINQYFVHAKMCENWGNGKLAEKVREESIDEMKHAESLVERILYLEGVPNLQRLGALRIGETVQEQFESDLAVEYAAIPDGGTVVVSTTLRPSERSRVSVGSIGGGPKSAVRVTRSAADTYFSINTGDSDRTSAMLSNPYPASSCGKSSAGSRSSSPTCRTSSPTSTDGCAPRSSRVPRRTAVAGSDAA